MYKLDNPLAHVPVLLTDRLILRKILPTDLDLLVPIAFYDGLYAQNREDAAKIIDRIYEDCLRGDMLHWGIALKESDEIIGTCGFYRGLCNNCGEIGYVLREVRRGKGYITEAARAVIKYGFEEIGLKSIVAHIAEHNYPSLKVAARLGFKEIPSSDVGIREFEKESIH